MKGLYLMNLSHLKARYSVKKFDRERKLSIEQVDLLKNAFHLCPSSLNIQPWKLVVVEDERLKNQIAEQTGKDTNVERIEECSHLFVLVRRPVTMAHCRRVVENTPIFQWIIERMKLTTGKLVSYFWFYSKKEGGKQWAARQVYLALGFLLATAAAEGIGALPMEGIRRRKMDKVLHLPRGERTVVALAVGYSHSEDAQNPSKLRKARFPKDEVVVTV